MPDDFVPTMPKPAWCRDTPKLPKKPRPKRKTAFNGCRDQDVSIPVRDQQHAVRSAIDLGERHLRFLAEHCQRQDRGQGLTPADYVRSLFGFAVSEAERELINAACARFTSAEGA